jgi:hypothetical protein
VPWLWRDIDVLKQLGRGWFVYRTSELFWLRNPSGLDSLDGIKADKFVTL